MNEVDMGPHSKQLPDGANDTGRALTEKGGPHQVEKRADLPGHLITYKGISEREVAELYAVLAVLHRSGHTDVGIVKKMGGTYAFHRTYNLDASIKDLIERELSRIFPGNVRATQLKKAFLERVFGRSTSPVTGPLTYDTYMVMAIETLREGFRRVGSEGSEAINHAFAQTMSHPTLAEVFQMIDAPREPINTEMFGGKLAACTPSLADLPEEWVTGLTQEDLSELSRKAQSDQSSPSGVVPNIFHHGLSHIPEQYKPIVQSLIVKMYAEEFAQHWLPSLNAIDKNGKIRTLPSYKLKPFPFIEWSLTSRLRIWQDMVNVYPILLRSDSPTAHQAMVTEFQRGFGTSHFDENTPEWQFHMKYAHDLQRTARHYKDPAYKIDPDSHEYKTRILEYMLAAAEERNYQEVQSLIDSDIKQCLETTITYLETINSATPSGGISLDNDQHGHRSDISTSIREICSMLIRHCLDNQYPIEDVKKLIDLSVHCPYISLSMDDVLLILFRDVLNFSDMQKIDFEGLLKSISNRKRTVVVAPNNWDAIEYVLKKSGIWKASDEKVEDIENLHSVRLSLYEQLNNPDMLILVRSYLQNTDRFGSTKAEIQAHLDQINALRSQLFSYATFFGIRIGQDADSGESGMQWKKSQEFFSRVIGWT